jgi:hypothetical protein
MQIYFPNADRDKIEVDSKQFGFGLVCQSQVNFMAKCIDYTIFVNRLAIAIDDKLIKSMDNNQINYLIRPSCSIVIFDDHCVGKERLRMSGQVIRSKSSFQNYTPGYELTIRIDFSENSKVFDKQVSIENRPGVKVMYLDFD